MLGKKVKQIRIQRNMSQEEMAKELGINRNQLSRIETGKSEPSANVIKKLCVNCSVNLYDLFEIKRFDNVNEEKYNYIIDSIITLLYSGSVARSTSTLSILRTLGRMELLSLLTTTTTSPLESFSVKPLG